MTLAIPTSSADTLLDDWLADVARAQKEEVGLLREALIASRESDAAVRKAMSNEGKAYTEKISTLEGEKQDLIFKVEKEENKVSELTKEGVDKERRLKHAQEARKEASEKEAKWRRELTEAVETGGKYKEEADAARVEMTSASARAGKCEASLSATNKSLARATEKAKEAEEQRLTSEGSLHDALSVKSGLEKHAEAREAAMAKEVKSRVACEARIENEWVEQKDIKAKMEELEGCKTKSKLVGKQLKEVEGKLKVAEEASIGKEEIEKLSAKCTKEKREVSDELSKLKAAHSTLQSEQEVLFTSQQEAQSAAGALIEKVRLSEGKMSACEEESKRTYAKLAKAEGDYDDALKANVTCNEELSRYLSYIGAATEGGEGGGGVPLSAASRLGRAVRHLLTSDTAFIKAYALAIQSAASNAFNAPNLQLKERASTLSRRLSSLEVKQPLVDVPISGRPLVYLCMSLLLLVVRRSLQMRSMRIKQEEDAKKIAALEEKVRIMTEVLTKAAAAPSTKGKLKEVIDVQ